MVDDSVPVRYEEQSLVRTHPLSKVLEEARFCVCVQCRRSLVEKQDIAIVQEGTGDGYTLGLTLREACTVFPTSTIEALG